MNEDPIGISIQLYEARNTARFEHPYIAKVYSIVLRLDENPSLGIILQKLQKIPEFMTMNEIIRMTHQICSALDCIHSKGYLHTDPYERNIMMTDNRDFKLIDFGTVVKIMQSKSFFNGDLIRFARDLYRITSRSVERKADLPKKINWNEIYTPDKNPNGLGNLNSQFKNCRDFANAVEQILRE